MSFGGPPFMMGGGPRGFRGGPPRFRGPRPQWGRGRGRGNFGGFGCFNAVPPPNQQFFNGPPQEQQWNNEEDWNQGGQEEQFDEDNPFEEGGPSAPEEQQQIVNPMLQGPPGGGGPPMSQGLNPAEVMAWLDQQHPFVLRRIHFHTGWLLEQHGVPIEPPDGPQGTEGWYNEEAINQPQMQGNQQQIARGGGAKKNKNKPRHPGMGWSKTVPPQSVNQWTPAGWVVKDNSHKITTKMKRLPEPDIIPPNGSAEYPEASADRQKLGMLKNNVSMMQFELNKICRRCNISSLNKDDLTSYPEEHQGKLKTAITCVSAAEKTLQDFRDFLKEEKYEKWNEEEKAKREEKVKKMIGEMPTGMPHKRPDSDETEDKQEEQGEAKKAKVVVFSQGENL